MPVPHRFQNLLEEPDSNAVVNRDDVQGSIQKKLHDLHSCVVTGQSGVGKAREAGKAIQALSYEPPQKGEPDDSLVVCILESTQLVKPVYPLLTTVTREVMSHCNSNVTLRKYTKLWEQADLLKQKNELSSGEVTDWFRQLGQAMDEHRIRLVLWFRALHRIWYHEELRAEFQREKEENGQIADLLLFLAQIHNPAKDAAAQRWALPYFSIVQARGLKDFDVRSMRATSNWRPGLVSVPAFSTEEISVLLKQVWSDDLSSRAKEKMLTPIADWFMNHTGGVAQRVVAVGRWVEDQVDRIHDKDIHKLKAVPVDEQSRQETLDDLLLEISNSLDTEEERETAQKAAAIFQPLADDFMTGFLYENKQETKTRIEEVVTEYQTLIASKLDPSATATYSDGTIEVLIDPLPPLTIHVNLDEPIRSPWDIRCLRCCKLA